MSTFWQQGFIALSAQLSAPELASLQHGYDAMLNRANDCGVQDRFLGGRIRQIVHLSRHYPDFFPSHLVSRFRVIADTLLECPTHRTFDMLMVKEPGDVAETPWHQDWSYSQMPYAAAGTIIPNRKLQFWLALDEVDVQNGCLHFLPGVHRGVLSEHVVASGDSADEGRLLALRQCDASMAVACPLPAGGCTIHVEGTPHFAGGNHSPNRRRRAYIFNFEPLARSA